MLFRLWCWAWYWTWFWTRFRSWYWARKDGTKESIKGDNVIMSVGYIPSPLDENAKLVGDCKKVGNLRTVIWGAWDVAMKL